MEPKFQSSHPAAADDDVLWKLNKNSIKNSHAQHREALSRGSFIEFFLWHVLSEAEMRKN